MVAVVCVCVCVCVCFSMYLFHQFLDKRFVTNFLQCRYRHESLTSMTVASSVESVDNLANSYSDHAQLCAD